MLQPKKQAQQSSKRQLWNVLSVVLESFYFAQETKAVFISNRYYKTSQTQDVEAKVPNVAFENWRSRNVTLHLNKKHVLFQVESSQEVLKTDFLNTTKEKSQAELKKTILERTQRRFGKFVISFR